MNGHKRKWHDPDEYEPAETIVLEEDAVMESGAFRKIVVTDTDGSEPTAPADQEW